MSSCRRGQTRHLGQATGRPSRPRPSRIRHPSEDAAPIADTGSRARGPPFYRSSTEPPEPHSTSPTQAPRAGSQTPWSEARSRDRLLHARAERDRRRRTHNPIILRLPARVRAEPAQAVSRPSEAVEGSATSINHGKRCQVVSPDQPPILAPAGTKVRIPGHPLQGRGRWLDPRADL
jgi:hypothetical protein